mgnify:CR=1 FL=1
MNSTKLIITYSKSLFQNTKTLQSSQPDLFDVAKITGTDRKIFTPTVYIIGEELLLIRATLLSSKKLKEFFKKVEKCLILLK